MLSHNPDSHARRNIQISPKSPLIARHASSLSPHAQPVPRNESTTQTKRQMAGRLQRAMTDCSRALPNTPLDGAASPAICEGRGCNNQLYLALSARGRHPRTSSSVAGWTSVSSGRRSPSCPEDALPPQSRLCVMVTRGCNTPSYPKAVSS